MNSATSLIMGYFIGSIPFTQIFAKIFKNIDLREVGSKNVGGMNSIHQLGLKMGLLTGFLDVMKGYFALLLAKQIGLPFPSFYWAGIGAIIGHNWPIWLKFVGGKGISVTIGICLFIAPIETIIAFILGLLLMLKNNRNIVLPATFSFFLILFLLIYNQHPLADILILIGAIGVMVLATIPNYLKLKRSKGGLKEYFGNPNKDYQD